MDIDCRLINARACGTSGIEFHPTRLDVSRVRIQCDMNSTFPGAARSLRGSHSSKNRSSTST